MMIAGLRFLCWDRGELYDGRLLEDFLSDLVGVRPFCLGGFVVSALVGILFFSRVCVALRLRQALFARCRRFFIRRSVFGFFRLLASAEGKCAAPWPVQASRCLRWFRD